MSVKKDKGRRYHQFSHDNNNNNNNNKKQKEEQEEEEEEQQKQQQQKTRAVSRRYCDRGLVREKKNPDRAKN